ncbi:MAG TPA: hypothetical protein PKW49_13905 [Paludibacteraceae bacterium]|nr:hypothetical protein [Paludibacteraceae bacterium]
MNNNCCKLKIAIISAYIGNGGDSGCISFTSQAKEEMAAYGVDIYSYRDTDLDSLLPLLEPSMARDEIIKENLFDKLRYFVYKRIYKQELYPSVEDDRTRLIAKIPKILFYKLVPNEYDYYVWLDSKFVIQEHWLKYLLWLISKYEGFDILVSKHSERSSIKEEMDFLVKDSKIPGNGVVQKYNIAELEYQCSLYNEKKSFRDDELYENTMIIYSKTILEKEKCKFLEEWYAHNYYFSIQDQISFPFLVHKYYNVRVKSVLQYVFDMPFSCHEYGHN